MNRLVDDTNVAVDVTLHVTNSYLVPRLKINFIEFCNITSVMTNTIA